MDGGLVKRSKPKKHAVAALRKEEKVTQKSSTSAASALLFCQILGRTCSS